MINNMPVRIVQSKRKTISIQLKSEEILVRAPRLMSRQEIFSFVQKKSGWIETHLKLIRERALKKEQVDPFTEEEIRALAEKARVVIAQRVRYYAPLIGVDYGRITIRNQRTRWGSCSGKGNLNFNCMLVLFPEEVLDYVVVHELCHRKHMNHSGEFYAEVEKVFPDYRRYQKWLKENGRAYLDRMP